jgi:hypothetical protein
MTTIDGTSRTPPNACAHTAAITAYAAAAALLLAGLPAASADVGIGAMTWQRRIIVMSAAHPQDADLAQQRRLLDAWTGGEERDVTVVGIAGDKVTGAADDAASLRRHFQLPSRSFMVILVGKDGHVALRSRSPVTGETFQRAIDAMPMRKAGER